MLSDHRPYWWAEIDEFAGGGLLAHIRFARFTPRTYREFLKEWHTSIHALKAPLFAFNGENGGDTWVKFVTKLGFKPTGFFHQPSGEEFYVFIPSDFT